MLYKNPALQNALLANRVKYDSAPAVKSDTPILTNFAVRQAQSNRAGTNAQRRIDMGNERLGLARAKQDFGTYARGRSSDSEREAFESAKKMGNLSSLFGVAGLGIRTAGAVAEKKRTDTILSTISDMEKRTREAGDSEGQLVAQILKMKYGR